MSVKDETPPFKRFPDILSAFSFDVDIQKRKKNVLNKALPKPTSNRTAFSIKMLLLSIQQGLCLTLSSFSPAEATLQLYHQKWK